MRRGTLITLIVLLVAIVAIAVYQLVLAAGVDRRTPGPARTPTSSPNPVTSGRFALRTRWTVER